MRFREPIIQPGLTKEEATDARDRYLRINPGARVTIDTDQAVDDCFYEILARGHVIKHAQASG